MKTFLNITLSLASVALLIFSVITPGLKAWLFIVPFIAAVEVLFYINGIGEFDGLYKPTNKK